MAWTYAGGLSAFRISYTHTHTHTYTHTHIQEGLVLRRGYVLEYLVVNRIVVKRVLFKWVEIC